MTPTEIAAGAVVSAGAALLPDLDHHSGTIASSFGHVSKWLCQGVAKVSGGHRHATHSLLFCVAMGVTADALARNVVQAWWVMLFVLVGLGLRGIGVTIPEREHFNVVLNGAIAAGLTFFMARMDFAGVGAHYGGIKIGWAGFAVGLGCLMHVFTDCLTPEGCPVLWPAPWRIGVPLVPRTNGTVERWVVTPILTLGIVILIFRTSAGDSLTHWLTTHRSG